ncbi:MAG: radical SAM protein [Desulfuromonadales bacterium]
MNILVVAPRNSTKIFPVGLAYVISALKREGHKVDCVNLNLSDELDIIRGRYDIVATGGLACHYSEVEKILSMARDSGTMTIVGGGIVSSEPELMTRELKPDYSVIGEGEITACELLACLEKGDEVSEVPGIAFVRDGQFFMTKVRASVRNLDALPFPDYDALGFREHLDNLKPSDVYYLDYFDYPRGYPVVSSRSCPFECTFCYHPLGKVYRERSIDSIIDELTEAVPRYRINVLEILDELFSLNEARLKEFCTRIKEFSATLDWDLKWGCQLRVGSINKETLEMLRDSGCYNLSLGLESYSNTVLASMKKKISQDQIHNAVHCILDTDLRLQGNFIFGDKAETMETAKETIDFWKEHSQAGIMLGFVQPYPDCELYRYCLQQGIIKDRLNFIKHHFFDTINMTKMSENEFINLRLEILRLDFKYNLHAIPEKVEPESVTLVCPHCRERMTYNNFHIVEKNSLLFSLRQNSYLYNKMMYCKKCGRRFWARSLFAQLLTYFVTGILKYPSAAIKVMHVRNVLFAFISGKGVRQIMEGISSPLEALNNLRRG